MGASLLPPPTIAEIHVAAFAHNVRAVRARLAPSCQLMAVVKANAYGHGAERLATVESTLLTMRASADARVSQHDLASAQHGQAVLPVGSGNLVTRRLDRLKVQCLAVRHLLHD